MPYPARALSRQNQTRKKKFHRPAFLGQKRPSPPKKYVVTTIETAGQIAENKGKLGHGPPAAGASGGGHAPPAPGACGGGQAPRALPRENFARFFIVLKPYRSKCTKRPDVPNGLSEGTYESEDTALATKQSKNHL
ncbi:MAG: hypothetical protein AMJ75_12540 [Phycisphaerae bacterium SM1_79]|nr:MAG: hypothetical protein AMJ75_12540 [Phycisphaerae bacterium SM1_79]